MSLMIHQIVAALSVQILEWRQHKAALVNMQIIYDISKFSFKEDGILLSHKKERNIDICSNMDGPTDYHTKGRKTEKERQIPHDITYMWNLK